MKRVIIFLLCFFCAPAASSKDMNLIPLEEYILLENAEKSYLFVRCLGLHVGLSSYVGTNHRTDKMTRNLERSITSFLNYAILTRMDANPDVSQGAVQEAVFKEADSVSEIYQSIWRNNYSATGKHGFGSGIAASDGAVCANFIPEEKS